MPPPDHCRFQTHACPDCFGWAFYNVNRLQKESPLDWEYELLDAWKEYRQFGQDRANEMALKPPQEQQHLPCSFCYQQPELAEWAEETRQTQAPMIQANLTLLRGLIIGFRMAHELYHD